MPQSAALLPAPFHPPVRTGTGSFFDFRAAARRPPLRIEQQRRSPLAELEHGLAYDGEGRMIADMRIGTLLNIYA